MNDFGKILEQAYQAAEHAAIVEDDRLGPEATRGFDCGFAWVDVPMQRDTNDATKAFVKYCKTVGSKACGKPRGYGLATWQFWGPAHAMTQSISVHYAGAVAFAAVLNSAGITATAGQRYD